MTDLLERVHSREWFYRFELPDGTATATYHGGGLDQIHETRWNMLESILDAEFPAGQRNLRAVDLAAHQGWFSVHLAQAGIANVTGVDTRAEHVADARLITAAMGLSNVEFIHSDVFDLDPKALGTFDLVLMLGLIYHLENPIGALRLARALCGRLCLIETQVVPGMSGMVDFGSYHFVRPLRGSFGIIDETDETHGSETGTTGICLVPSIQALTWLLTKVGFSRCQILRPPPGAYEQLRHGKRVMVAAWV